MMRFVGVSATQVYSCFHLNDDVDDDADDDDDDDNYIPRQCRCTVQHLTLVRSQCKVEP